MPSANALRSPSHLLYAAFLFVAPVPSIAQEPPASEEAFCSNASNHFQAGGKSIPYEIVDGMAVVEGDIIVGRSDDSATYGTVVLQKARTWDRGVFPYKFAAGFPRTKQLLVEEAFRLLNRQTNDAFTFTEIAPNQSYTDYVTFNVNDQDVCNSWVGKKRGEQLINLGKGCNEPEILHEIGHALGLYHEHDRPDRNLYVKINWNNIDVREPGARTAFCRVRTDEGAKKGPYDFDSIMHYSSRDFAYKGTITIEAREVGKKVPDRHNQVLSAGDTKALAELYGFPPPTGTPPPTDQNQKICNVSSTERDLINDPVFVHAYKNSVAIVFALAADSRILKQADEYDDHVPSRRRWYKIKVDKSLRTFDQPDQPGGVGVLWHGRPVLNKIEAVGWVFAEVYDIVVHCR